MNEVASKGRILIVDDNAAIHEDFRQILSPSPDTRDDEMKNMERELFEGTGAPADAAGTADYEIEDAFSGEKAIEMVHRASAENRPYSVIFMDVRMPPGMDGIEAIERIWKDHPDIEMVICTAFSDYSWEEILSHFGKTDKLLFIRKPFDSVMIRQISLNLTTKSDLRRKHREHMATLEDLVARRTAELRTMVEDVSRLGARYRSLVEAAPVGIVAIRQDGTIRDMNPAIRKILAAPEQSVGGTTRFFEDPPFADLPGIERVRTSLEENMPITFDCEYTDSSGVDKSLSIHASPLPSNAGDGGCMAIIEDVSDRKSLEEQLLHSEKMRVVGQMAGGFAHDFNNILTIIKGHLELIRVRGAPEGDSDRLQGIMAAESAVEQAANLISKILAFSRKEQNQSVAVDINNSVTDVIQMLKHSIDKRIVIETALECRSSRVRGDPVQLQNAILNLALNARDAMPRGGRLTIRTMEKSEADVRAMGVCPEGLRGDDYLVLEIADTGSGIDANTRAHIFEPFFSTKQSGRGLGLGLASVYNVVKSHNGAVGCDSEPGKGTRFTLCFPLDKGHESSEPPEAPGNLIEGRGAVMVVDDEPLVLDLAEQFLDALGFEPAGCRSGEEAVEYYEQNRERIKLVILDMVMPGMGGYETFKHLRAINPTVKAIIASGYAMNNEIRKTLDEGAVGFLQKPYGLEALSDMIGQHVPIE